MSGTRTKALARCVHQVITKTSWAGLSVILACQERGNMRKGNPHALRVFVVGFPANLRRMPRRAPIAPAACTRTTQDKLNAESAVLGCAKLRRERIRASPANRVGTCAQTEATHRIAPSHRVENLSPSAQQDLCRQKFRRAFGAATALAAQASREYGNFPTRNARSKYPVSRALLGSFHRAAYASRAPLVTKVQSVR